MITITKQDNQILMQAHFHYKDRLKKVRGARFDFDKKVWHTDIKNLDSIEALFKGEIYYKTPFHVLHGTEKKKEPVVLYDDSIQVPELNLPLFPYQQDGVKFMIDRIKKLGFVLNSDVMGTGKTVQTIATLKWFMENRGVERVLIICKRSVKTQWAEEIVKFAGEMPVTTIAGTKKQRNKLYESFEDGFLITNYHNFLNDREEIRRCKADMVVIDEVHSVKGRTTKMNKNIKYVVNRKPTILLTGTPVMSKPDDLYGIVSIASDIFESHKKFENNYLVAEYGIYGYQVVGAKNLDKLHSIIKDFMIRRTTDDISLDLPTELPPIRMSVEPDKVQKEQMKYIQVLKDKMDEEKAALIEKCHGNIPPALKAQLDEINDKSKRYIAVMQFISDDPLLFHIIPPKSEVFKKMQDMTPEKHKISPKTEALLDLVDDIGDSKVIIFCHFATSAKYLQNLIEKSGKKAVAYIGAMNDKERAESVREFCKGDADVFIGTDAAAEGLNLQVAKYLINYEQADTYAQRKQRIGRIRRIGSKYTDIRVYDLCTQGMFDEVKINKLQKDKMYSDSLIDA